MIINNKSVIGVYKYSDNAIYEKGDFIIYNNGIYVCNKEVSGEKPSEKSKNFSIYLGERTATEQDYYDYVNNPNKDELSDKYISMFTLSKVLQNMYFGLDDNGVINNYYNSPDDYCINSITNIDESLSILDIIMSENELNNGMIRLSRQINEVKSLITSTVSDSKSYYSNDDESNDYVILRQYTYDSSSSVKEEEESNLSEIVRYRVQELIDPVYGESYYRFSKGTEDESGNWRFNTTSSWKYSFSGEPIIGNKVRGILSYVNDLETNYNNELEGLKGSFRFKLAKKPNLNLKSVILKSSELNVDLAKSCLMTVIVNKLVDESRQIYKNFSVTFDTLNGIDTSYNLYIDDDCYVSSIISNNREELAIELKGSLLNNYKINTVYYQQTYNN